MKTNSFRQRLLRGDALFGTFVKTPHYQIVELLAKAGLDFIVLDAEHAPYDKAALDASIMAARLIGLPVLVRVCDNRPETPLAVLDMGATGVVIPHVGSAVTARAVARAGRYNGGTRGFSNSTRAGGYGATPLSAHIEQADREVVVIGQIEDAAALDVLDEILSVDGIDCFFIGRADLMVSLEATSLDDMTLTRAVEKICDKAKQRDRRLGMFLPGTGQIADFKGMGVSLFVIGSDQSLLIGAAGGMAAAAKGKSKDV